MSLPRPIITVLAHFEPLFTAPTWKKVVILLVGTVLARGRRTVTAACGRWDGKRTRISAGFIRSSTVRAGRRLP